MRDTPSLKILFFGIDQQTGKITLLDSIRGALGTQPSF